MGDSRSSKTSLPQDHLPKKESKEPTKPKEPTGHQETKETKTGTEESKETKEEKRSPVKKEVSLTESSPKESVTEETATEEPTTKDPTTKEPVPSERTSRESAHKGTSTTATSSKDTSSSSTGTLTAGSELSLSLSQDEEGTELDEKDIPDCTESFFKKNYRLAQKGDSDAQCKIAWYYYQQYSNIPFSKRSHPIAQDYLTQYYFWMNKSLAEDHPGALMWNCLECFKNKDFIKANLFLDKVSKLPNPGSFFQAILTAGGFFVSNSQLVLITQDGIGLFRDTQDDLDFNPEQSAGLFIWGIMVDWLRRAPVKEAFLSADQNDPAIQFNLGMTFWVHSKNSIEAIRALCKAAENNYPPAIHFLKYLLPMYLEKGYGVYPKQKFLYLVFPIVFTLARRSEPESCASLLLNTLINSSVYITDLDIYLSKESPEKLQTIFTERFSAEDELIYRERWDVWRSRLSALANEPPKKESWWASLRSKKGGSKGSGSEKKASIDFALFEVDSLVNLINDYLTFVAPNTEENFKEAAGALLKEYKKALQSLPMRETQVLINMINEAIKPGRHSKAKQNNLILFFETLQTSSGSALPLGENSDRIISTLKTAKKDLSRSHPLLWGFFYNKKTAKDFWQDWFETYSYALKKVSNDEARALLVQLTAAKNESHSWEKRERLLEHFDMLINSSSSSSSSSSAPSSEHKKVVQALTEAKAQLKKSKPEAWKYLYTKQSKHGKKQPKA